MKTNQTLLVRALRGEKTERTPAWLMRQAGRFLTEYRELRAKHDFLEVVKTPELAAEVSLQPWRAFRPDGVIMFSDILTPLEGMGIPFRLDEGGPRILDPVRTEADLKRVNVADPTESMPYVFELIRTLNKELDGAAPVLGFAGAPFTVGHYVVGPGAHKKESGIKALAYTDPKTLHKLLGLLADQTASYLAAQVEAGVGAVQLFDTWAGELSEEDYLEFAIPYQQRSLAQVTGKVPTIIYVLGGSAFPHLLGKSGADVVSIDWRIDIHRARKIIGEDVVLQGNLDPTVLLGDASEVKRRVIEILEKGGGARHVFNLGHGLLPSTPRENVALLFETVRAWSPGQT